MYANSCGAEIFKCTTVLAEITLLWRFSALYDTCIISSVTSWYSLAGCQRCKGAMTPFQLDLTQSNKTPLSDRLTPIRHQRLLEPLISVRCRLIVRMECVVCDTTITSDRFRNNSYYTYSQSENITVLEFQ